LAPAQAVKNRAAATKKYSNRTARKLLFKDSWNFCIGQT